ncbi:hypothetical protein Tco_0896892, partial [Tanacetum coccineum]
VRCWEITKSRTSVGYVGKASIAHDQPMIMMMMMMTSCLTSPAIEVAVLSDKDSVLGGSTVPIYKKFDGVELVLVVVDGCDGGCGGDALFGSSGFEWKNGLSVVVGDDDGDGGCGGGDDVTGNNGVKQILDSLDANLNQGSLDFCLLLDLSTDSLDTTDIQVRWIQTTFARLKRISGLLVLQVPGSLE